MDNKKKKLELQRKINKLQKKENELRKEIEAIKEKEKLSKQVLIEKMKGRTFMSECNKFLLINGVDSWDGNISVNMFQFNFDSWLVDVTIIAPTFESIKQIKTQGFKEVSRKTFFEALKKNSNELINNYEKR